MNLTLNSQLAIELSNFDKQGSDAHLVSFLFYYYCKCKDAKDPSFVLQCKTKFYMLYLIDACK